MPLVTKIGGVVFPTSRPACCSLRGNGRRRRLMPKTLFRRHSSSSGDAITRFAVVRFFTPLCARSRSILSDVRQRYEKLQNNDLPAVAPRIELYEDDVDEEDPSPSSFEQASLQFFRPEQQDALTKTAGFSLRL